MEIRRGRAIKSQAKGSLRLEIPVNPNIPDPKDENDFPTFHVNVSCSSDIFSGPSFPRKMPRKMRLESSQIFK
jgi:hypothetical protein